jgi:DNA-binding IscR family transcriptional regulator
MLTQRSRYALRAMMFLAEAPKDSPPIPMNRIALEANVPRKFLELILAAFAARWAAIASRARRT